MIYTYSNAEILLKRPGTLLCVFYQGDVRCYVSVEPGMHSVLFLNDQSQLRDYSATLACQNGSVVWSSP